MRASVIYRRLILQVCRERFSAIFKEGYAGARSFACRGSRQFLRMRMQAKRCEERAGEQ